MLRMTFQTIMYALLMVVACFTGQVFAQGNAVEKSFYSPIIFVDTEKGLVVISTHSGVIAVEASEAAKPHLDQLPVNGMIDITVVSREGGKFPLIKSWTVAAGESRCKHFDGKSCK